MRQTKELTLSFPRSFSAAIIPHLSLCFLIAEPYLTPFSRERKGGFTRIFPLLFLFLTVVRYNVENERGGLAVQWSDFPWKTLEILLPVLLGVGCLAGARVFHRAARGRDATYTIAAQAQVIQVLAATDSDGDSLYTPVLRLWVDGTAYTKRGSSTREKDFFQTGAWVPVRYPPGKPSRFVPAGEVGTSAASGALCLGAFFCFLGALVRLVQDWNLYF